MSEMTQEELDEELERARHLVAQGGEAGFTDAQIEQAQQLLDRFDGVDEDEVFGPGDDPLFQEFDTVYRCCELLRDNLIDNADLRLNRSHHRMDLKETIADLDMLDRFLEVFKAEMDPRDEPET